MGANLWPADAVAGSPSYIGRVLRQLVGAWIGGKTAARPLGGRSGVIAGADPTVSVTGTTWTVGPFPFVADLEAAAVAGPYTGSFDTDQTGSVTAAHATLDRIDRWDVQISDPAEGDGSVAPVTVILYTAGTPGSGTTAAAPPRSFPLLTATVPHSGGGSPAASRVYPYTVAAGGITPGVVTGAEPSLPYLGQYIDTGQGLQRYDGTTWRPSTDKPLFVGYQHTAQSVPDGAWTPLSIDTEEIDTSSSHSTTTNKAFYTASRPGWYRCTVRACFSNNGSGIRGAAVGVNSSTVPTPTYAQMTEPAVATVSPTRVTYTGVVFVSAAGGNIVALCFQASGGSLSTTVDQSSFSVEYLHS